MKRYIHSIVHTRARTHKRLRLKCFFSAGVFFYVDFTRAAENVHVRLSALHFDFYPEILEDWGAGRDG